MKKIVYECDNWCQEKLEIEFPESEEYEFECAGWTHDKNVANTHYCQQCSSTLNDDN